MLTSNIIRHAISKIFTTQTCPGALDAPGALQAVLRGWVAALLESGRVGAAVAAQLTRALLGAGHPALRVIVEPLQHLEVHV